jgi:hypothetical protein
MNSRTEVKDSLSVVLLCSAVTLVLWFIPYAELLVYPFRIFVTLIHETGHAVAALLTLGGVNRITIDWNGSGAAETVGGMRLFISSAGYLGAAVYGAGLMLLLRRARFAKPAALVTGVGLLLVTVFLAGNLTAWLAGLVFGLGLLFVAVKASIRFVQFFMSFLAVQALLNAFYDLRTLLYLSVFDPSRLTDAQNMAIASNGWIPAVVWAIGWGALSLAILAATVVVYYRSLRAPTTLQSLPELRIPERTPTV